jgi:hypothetical protein
MPPSQEDLNFYTHELDEFQRYKNLGFETGLPDDPHAQQELWNNAHTAALEDYGLKEVVDGKVRCIIRTATRGFSAIDLHLRGWPFGSDSN